MGETESGAPRALVKGHASRKLTSCLENMDRLMNLCHTYATVSLNKFEEAFKDESRNEELVDIYQRASYEKAGMRRFLVKFPYPIEEDRLWFLTEAEDDNTEDLYLTLRVKRYRLYEKPLTREYFHILLTTCIAINCIKDAQGMATFGAGKRYKDYSFYSKSELAELRKNQRMLTYHITLWQTNAYLHRRAYAEEIERGDPRYEYKLAVIDQLINLRSEIALEEIVLDQEKVAKVNELAGKDFSTLAQGEAQGYLDDMLSLARTIRQEIIV